MRRISQITVRRRTSTVLAAGTEVCVAVTDDCCTPGDSSGSIPFGVDCCPGEVDSLVAIAFVGPFGESCAEVSLLGDLLFDTVSWSGEVTGDGVTADAVMYCAEQKWWVTLTVTSGLSGSDSLSFGPIEVVLDTEEGSPTIGKLIGSAPSDLGCDPSDISVAADLPCVEVSSYNCVADACVAVEGTGGTYSTLEECQAACGTETCCSEASIPSTLYVTFDGVLAHLGTVELTYNGFSVWETFIDACGQTNRQLTLTCLGSVFQLLLVGLPDPDGPFFQAFGAPSSCVPFSLSVTDATAGGGTCGSGSVTGVVSETP